MLRSIAKNYSDILKNIKKISRILDGEFFSMLFKNIEKNHDTLKH